MKRFSFYFRKMILFFLLLLNGIILYYAFFTFPGCSEYLESVVARPQYMLIIGVLFIFGLIYILFSMVDQCKKRHEKKLCIALISILVLGQLFFIFSFDVTQITDAFIVKDQALAIVNGIDPHINYEDIWYFRRYGNNNFIVLLFIQLYRMFRFFHITNDTIPFAVCNAFFIDLGLFFVYLTLKKLKREKTGIKFLLLCVLSPLSYYCVWWIYSCTFSIPIGTAILYLSVLLYCNRRRMAKVVLYATLIGILLTLGYLLRPTACIPLIATVCCLLLSWKQAKWNGKRIGMGFLCLILATTGSYGWIQKHVERYAVESKDNFPITHWLMMGIHTPGTVNSEDNAFTEAFETKEEKQAANLEEIERTLQEYGVSGFVNHCIQKLPITWANGMSEGEMRMRQIGKGNPWYQWLVGEKTDFIGIYSQSLYITVFILMFWSIMSQRNDKRLRIMFVFSLTVFGGMIFYLFWEAKASYNIPFVPFLYVLASDGSRVLKKSDGYLKRKNIIALGKAVMFATVLMGISNYWIFVKNEVDWKQYSIYSNNEVLMTWEGKLSKEDKILEQEFYPNLKFNSVSISCKAMRAGEATYRVQVWSENKMVFEKKVKKEKIEDSKIILKFPTQAPGEKYRLRILPEEAGQKDTIKWGSHYTRCSDQYKGNCYLNGKKLVSDLFIRVYQEKEDSYMKPVPYIMLCVGILIGEWFILVQVLRLEKEKKEKMKLLMDAGGKKR